MNRELPDVQAGFRKGRGTRDQIANICWIIRKAREFQNNISFCFIDYTKAFDCVDHNKLWKILQESQRILYFSSVQSFSCVRLFATPWIAAYQASLSITNSTTWVYLNVYRVGDAIQSSHPLSSPSPAAPNPSQHQGLLQGVNSLHEVTKVLEFQLQHQSFQWTPRIALNSKLLWYILK